MTPTHTPDDHQFVESGRVGELGDPRRGDVAAREDLPNEELRDALSGLVGVVIALGVDDESFEHGLHPLCYLGFELGKLVLRDELLDVVVRMETTTCASEPFADAVGDRCRALQHRPATAVSQRLDLRRHRPPLSRGFDRVP
jgi:hypothetical protein